MTEKELQRMCIDLLNVLQNQGRCIWFHDYDSRKNPSGLPDLLLWSKNKDRNVQFTMIELKSPDGKGKLRKSQTQFNDFMKHSQYLSNRY